MTPTLVVLAALLAAAAPVPPTSPPASGAAKPKGNAVAPKGAAVAPAKPADVLADPGTPAILAREARRLGLHEKPETAKQLRAVRADLAIEELVRANAKEPTEAELRAAYHAKMDQAQVQAVFRASREDAAAALERLRKGAALGDEAKQSVEPISREKAGDIGWLARRDLPAEVAAAAFSGKTNVWSGPFQVGNAWAVVRATDRQVANEAGFKEGRFIFKEALLGERLELSRVDLIRSLRARTRATTDEAFLREAAQRAPTAEDRKRVVAKAGERTITYGDVIAATASATKGAHGGAGMQQATLHQATADQLLDRALLEAEAARTGAAKRPRAARPIQAASDEILAGAYFDWALANTPAPTQQEIEAEYAEHRKAMDVAASRTCAHVVTRTQEEAKAARARIAAGEPFDAVARQVSTDKRTAVNGGVIGALTDEGLAALGKKQPAIAEAVRKLPPNQVSEPVKSTQGWHVLRCDALLPARTRPLAEVKDELAGNLRLERAIESMRSKVVAAKAAKPKSAAAK
jgi:parvulin-like peptidyl-prolyl isomerase